MVLAILRKKDYSRGEYASLEPGEFIDLSQMTFADDGQLGAKTLVKVAEIYRYEDLSKMTNHVFNGHILILDYTALSGDQLAMKRITNDLKMVARDVGGDVAGLGKNYFVVTPGGVKVDRNKIKGGF
ncbi:MAG: cell division protein SepF [Methanomassiliicoccales archaeon]